MASTVQGYNEDLGAIPRKTRLMDDSRNQQNRLLSRLHPIWGSCKGRTRPDGLLNLLGLLFWAVPDSEFEVHVSYGLNSLPTA